MALQVTGVDQVLARFARFSRSTDNLDAAFDAIGAAITARAVELAPRRTGALAATIHTSRGGRFASVAAGGGSVPYAGVQEYGWAARHIAAQPFLRPAADTSTADAVDDLTTEIKRAIQAAGLG